MARHRLPALIRAIAAWLGWALAGLAVLVLISALASLVHHAGH